MKGFSPTRFPAPPRTALGWAAAFCAALLVCAAAQRPADRSEPLLFQALRRGSDVLLRTLLQEGRPADGALEDGTTPLMAAALYGSVDSVRCLLAHGADATAANAEGVTALLWGAGDAEKVQLLLAHGADPNARSKLGNTPLIAACRHPGATLAVQRLIAAGAATEGVRRQNRQGRTPLENAAMAGNAAVVQLLLESGRDHGKNRALAKAAEFGKLAVVRHLLEAGANPNAVDGRSAGHSLDAALLSNRPAVARLLLEHGADIEIPTRTGKDPPIVLAAFTETGDDTILKELIARGADVNARNARGETALHWAQRRGHGHLVKLLVDAGAKEGTLPARKQKAIPDRSLNLHAGNRQEQIRSAVGKSLVLLQRSSDVFLLNRESCVSCHHQNLPAVAFGWARDRGFQVSPDSIARLVERQEAWMRPRVDRAYQMDEPVPVPPRLIGWGMLGQAALDRPSSAVSEALSHYLAAIQQADGHWDSRALRPPMGGGEVLSTALALRTLQVYPPPGKPAVSEERVARARAWLRKVEPTTHQEAVFRLLGLGWAGAEQGALAGAVLALRRQQHADGGWAQLPGLESDAWATGQTLVALHIAGGVAPIAPAYERGLAFLLRTQFDDGSWFVPTRTWPFQPHFDSQFPHGKDQWISAPATAWACMALTLAVEPGESSAIPLPADDAPVLPDTSEALAEGRGGAAAVPVDFRKHIQPVLERSCVGCHGSTNPKSGFQVTDRAALLRGGESGLPAILPGRGSGSPLVRQVRGQVEDMEMPPLSRRTRYPALTAAEADWLSAWIDGGARWPEGATIASPDAAASPQQ